MYLYSSVIYSRHWKLTNDYFSNTFNDEYDTYIHSEDVASQTIIKVEHQTNFALLPETNFDLQTPTTKFCQTHFTDKADKTFEQKLFLKNRSLLI